MAPLESSYPKMGIDTGFVYLAGRRAKLEEGWYKVGRPPLFALQKSVRCSRFKVKLSCTKWGG